MIPRSRAAQLGRETVAILEAGYYTAPSGRQVSVAEAVARAREATRLHGPDHFPQDAIEKVDATVLEVTDESTLAAASRLVSAAPECNPCCLNFASAKHPGGGFLSGARAQEESLARSSGLYACIGPVQKMYQHNRHLGTCLYSDYMIHSSGVPVFRTDEGDLLEEPYLVSFLTAPAVNAGALRPEEEPHIEPTMRGRAEKVLRVAYHHGHTHVILGAWGCGVFRNDPAMVADHFAGLLGPGGLFHRVFRHVVFAVLDYGPGKETHAAFAARLGPLAQ
jgi:uncharacterized protein (TIGR02452 family)